MCNSNPKWAASQRVTKSRSKVAMHDVSNSIDNDKLCITMCRLSVIATYLAYKSAKRM